MACQESNNSENAAILKEQDELIAFGITSTTTDGTSVTHSLGYVKDDRRQRQLQDPATVACGGGRPLCVTPVFDGRG